MHDVQDIIEKYLGSASSYSRKSEPNEKYYYCPSCNWKNPRLSVDYGKNMFHCWYCQWGGRSLTQILYKMGADKSDILYLKNIFGEQIKEKKYNTSIDQLRIKIRESLSESKEQENTNRKKYFLNERGHFKIRYNDDRDDEIFKPLYKNNSLLAKNVRRYLFKERGLSKYEISYYNIYFGKDSVLFLNFENDKIINYWVKRSIQNKFYEIPDKEQVKKSEIVFFDKLIDYSQPVILAEGIFDAINIGFNAIPMLGTFANKELVKKLSENNCPLVYVWLDDEALDSAVKISNYLRSYGIESLVVCDYNYDDPAIIPRKEVNEILKNKTRNIDKFEFMI